VVVVFALLVIEKVINDERPARSNTKARLDNKQQQGEQHGQRLAPIGRRRFRLSFSSPTVYNIPRLLSLFKRDVRELVLVVKQESRFDSDGLSRRFVGLSSENGTIVYIQRINQLYVKIINLNLTLVE
jgi:hypothetical protein